MKSIFLAVAIALGACSGSPEGGSAEYTLDLSSYRPGQQPAALFIANETVVLPLGVGSRAQALSADAPGELRALYTRVGCNVVPNEWIGAGGVAPVQLPATPPVDLREVTIEQLAGLGVTASPAELAAETCVTFRSQDGKWQPFSRPSSVAESGPSVRAAFTVDAAGATAVAIFLPHYTYLSKISYRIAE